MKTAILFQRLLVSIPMLFVLVATTACDLLFSDKEPDYHYALLPVVSIDSIRLAPSQANFFITCGTPDPAWSYHAHTFAEKNDTVEVTVTGKRDRAVIAPQVIGTIPVEIPYAATNSGTRTFRFGNVWDTKWIDTTIVIP